MTGLLPEARQRILDHDAKYEADAGEFFFTGIQALVRLPLDQLRADARASLSTSALISGYPGSPLGGYDIELKARTSLLAENGIVHRPGLNEELAATAIMGSQLTSQLANARYDGVLGVWYGKAPGLDRASDAIRHANFAGTSPLGGALALVGDDPANKSSTLPSGSEHTLADLGIPTLFPGNVQEVADFGRHAVALSRGAGLWVALKIVTAVADGTGSVALRSGSFTPAVPTIDYRGREFVPHVETNFGLSNALEAELFEARLPLAEMYPAVNPSLNQITVDPGDAWLGIVASGQTYYEVIAALEQLGMDRERLRQHGVRLLRMGMVFPVEPGIVLRFARGLDEILVVEEKRAFLEHHIKDVLYGASHAPRVVGKRGPDGGRLVADNGALDADSLAGPLAERLRQRIGVLRLRQPAEVISLVSNTRRQLPVVSSRGPFVCSGCPHSTSLKAPQGALVGSGIGCHALVGRMDPARVGTVTGATQMGGEGAQWIGIEPFVTDDHFFQNIGDGTFFHSGSLAVRATVAASSHITFKILYNSAVAMTGGQQVPGARPIPELVAGLLAEGVRKIIVTTEDTGRYRRVRLAGRTEVWDRSRIVEAQELLRGITGVTVLIHDQQCAAEKRRDRRRGRQPEASVRVAINERVCEGCGDCGTKSSCLSVQPLDTEFGRKTQIHQSSCNSDYTCLDGDCPSFMTVSARTRRRKAPGPDPVQAKRQGGGRRLPPLPAAELPEPTPAVPHDDFTVRMPGVGGTGVVTASQIIGTAAMLDGRFVWGLDQTGLSQKACPVVSDLRISVNPIEGTNKIANGCVDTYLGLDMLVAAGTALNGTSADRSLAVVSTSQTPTSEMVTDPDTPGFDTTVMRARINAATRAADNLYLDAFRITSGLFGETTAANTLLLGAAYQRGALPIAAAAIEQAIELNGAAVEVNTLAFRWGRMLVLEASLVEEAMASAGQTSQPPAAADLAMFRDLDRGELGRRLRIRIPDLVGYQNRAYARRYLNLVRQTAAAEASAVPGSTTLAEAVATNLYKLMAYKDEYEVPRLLLAESARAQLRAEFGDNIKIRHHLHPPLLRALGMHSKIQLGPWAVPALKLLRAGRRLRGTAFDPFGWTQVRRLERALIEEYTAAIELVIGDLTAASRENAVRLAQLPQLIRGYEEIKLASVSRYRTELAQIRSELGGPGQ